MFGPPLILRNGMVKYPVSALCGTSILFHPLPECSQEWDHLLFSDIVNTDTTDAVPDADETVK